MFILNRATLRAVFAVIASSALLIACAGDIAQENPESNQQTQPAPVTDRSNTSTNDDAATQPLAQSQGFIGHPLDDPNSPPVHQDHLF